MNRRVALLVALAVLASCATRPPAASKEIFDEQSASTLSVVSQPLVFARERTDVAAHSRDYATLVAVEDDRSGQYSQYLLLYRWSTVDRRMSPLPAPESGKLQILADGRTIDLKPMERPPTSLAQRRALHVPEHGDVVYRAYRVDAALLNFIAASREITVRMPQEPFDTPFTLWKDGRAALAQFLKGAAAP
jgi:hypothetical protein